MEGKELSALEWKKLYLQMEGKLKQFRIQTVSIRTKLSQKMEELTSKFEQAEERAADADYQLSLLRDNIAGIPGASVKEESFFRDKIEDLEKRCLQCQERNLYLEKELEYERYMRKLEKDSVHEKAGKIKEWVSRTLNATEVEKEELKEANSRLNAAVQSMQKRLTELLNDAGTSKSQKTDSIPAVPTTLVATGDGDHVPGSPVSSPTTWHTSPLFENKLYSEIRDVTSQCSSPVAMNTEHSEYQNDVVIVPESSELKESYYETVHDVTKDDVITTPKEDDDAKLPPLYRMTSSKPRGATVKSAGDTDMIPVVVKEEDPSKSGKKSSTLPMTRSVASKPNVTSSTPTHHHFMGTFGSIRRKFKGLTDHHQRNREDTPTSSRGRDKREKQRTKSKSPTSRSNSSSRLRTSPVAISPSSTSGSTPAALPVITQEEEDMIIDPPPVLLSSSLPTTGCKGYRSNRPPTPPTHQLPLWESRIYELAANGFKFSSGASNKPNSSKHALQNLDYEIDEFAQVVHEQNPVSVPVYTKIKGRAARIRQSPFTDASDSSDDDVTMYPPSPIRQLSPRHRRSLTTSTDVNMMQQRRNGSPGLARAIKRANSQQSMASSEGDYAIPPDAHAYAPNTDNSEPEHKLFKTSKNPSSPSANQSGVTSPRTMVNLKIDVTPEVDSTIKAATKCGFLTKLGGRVRTCKKRWFVLRNGSLFYYKTSNDLARKHQGQIVLNVAKVTRDDVDSSTFQIMTGKKTHYLTAQSSQVAHDWITALQGAGNQQKTSCNSDDVIVTSGWVTRTIGGSSCRAWARMRNGTLEYFEQENSDEMPFERFKLKGCSVEEVQLNIPSPLNAGHGRPHSPPAFDHVIVIRPISDGGRDVFLSFETEEQKLSWLRKLTSVARASSSTSSLQSRKAASRDLSTATEYERLVVKLLQSNPKSRTDDKYGGSIWRNPVMSYSKQGITRPLTTLSSEAMQTEALKIAKSIQLFVNVSLDAASADYHVTLAQRIAHSCLTHVELRNELFSQLIKLTNRRGTEIADVSDTSYLQTWKLLSLILPIFLPQNKLLSLLRLHLKRHANHKCEIGQYVIYCQRTMQRAVDVGERMTSPSRTESLSILLHNPYNHSLPFSLPVHFADGSYQVVSFDGSTTVNEYSQRVTEQCGLRHHTTSGFALYVDDPDVTKSLKHYVEQSVKLCDVISTWETVSRHGAVTSRGTHLPQDGANDSMKATAKFSFVQRLTFKTYQKLESDKERHLMVYQIIDAISRDHFPLSRDLAIEMTSLASQIHYGDRSRDSSGSSLDHVINRFHPMRYRGKHQQKQTRERINERWMALEGTSTAECVRIFLNVARKWTLCGASLFPAKNETSGKRKGDMVWLCVNEDCLTELSYRTMDFQDKCEFHDVITFGGCKDQFMVVMEMAGVSRKLFYSLPKLQMVELVQLMADYMNASNAFGAKMRMTS